MPTVPGFKINSALDDCALPGRASEWPQDCQRGGPLQSHKPATMMTEIGRSEVVCESGR